MRIRNRRHGGRTLASVYQLVALSKCGSELPNPRVGNEFISGSCCQYYLGDDRWDMYSLISNVKG